MAGSGKLPRQVRFMAGFHVDTASWTSSEGSPARFDAGIMIEQARLAERGLYDALFMADFYAYRPAVKIDPMTLAAAICAATSHIGYVCSVSTTYEDPVEIARMMATLDRLSGGRAGWNMVTTANGTVAANFGATEHMEHDSRYVRAHEVLEAITRLWAEQYPLLRPILSQAGSSGPGRGFAARWADFIFTAQPDLEIAQGYYADVKRRVAHAGRLPETVRIMPGMHPTLTGVGAAEPTAWASPPTSAAERAAQLEDMIAIPLSQLPQDEAVPLDLVPSTSAYNGIRSRAELYHAIIRKRRLSPRELLDFNPHLTMTGSPDEVADQIQTWFETRACDGFVLFSDQAEQRAAFVDLVVPILQRRGLYPERYSSPRWSERLGLGSGFARQRAAAAA